MTSEEDLDPGATALDRRLSGAFPPPNTGSDSSPARLRPADLMAMQSTVGNRAVQRLVARTEAPGPAPAPNPPKPQATNALLIQREDEQEGGGLLGWVTNAWNDVKRGATAAVSGVGTTVTAGIDGLGKVVESASSSVTSGWEGLKKSAGNLLQSAERSGTGLIGGVLGHLKSAGTALVEMDAGALKAGWGAVKSVAAGALSLVKGLADGALRAADGLWNGLKGTAEGLLKGLSGSADSFFKTVEGGLQQAKSAATGLWNALTGRVGSVLKKLPGWSLIERGWTALTGTLETIAAKLIETARTAWKGIEKRATDLWKAVDQQWTAFRNAAAKRAKDMIDGIQRVVSGLASSAIEKVIGAVTKFAQFFKVLGQAIKNPSIVIDPIVKGITAKLAGVPAQAPIMAKQKIQEAAGGAGDPAPGPATPGAGGSKRIQRMPAPDVERGTVGAGTLASLVRIAIEAKLGEIWSHLGQVVKDMVLGMVWPPDMMAGLVEDWDKMKADLSKTWNRFEGVNWHGSWGEIWTGVSRWLSQVGDLYLIIWRAIAALGGRLTVFVMVWGALGGLAMGGPEGALAVIAAVGAVGEAFFGMFIIGETLSIVKAVGDLVAVPQSLKEQQEDYDQIADSVIGLAVAVALWALFSAAVAIARGLISLAKGVKPKVGEPEPGGSRKTSQGSDAKADEPVAITEGLAKIRDRIKIARDKVASLRKGVEAMPDQAPDGSPNLEKKQLKPQLEEMDRDLTDLDARANAPNAEDQRNLLFKGIEGTEKKIVIAEQKVPITGPGGRALTRAEAFSRFHQEIEANPNREYAIAQHGDKEEFAVIVGENLEVNRPSSLGSDWRLIEHHHADIKFQDPITGNTSTATNFKSRLPSVTDYTEGPMATAARTGRPAQEGFTWKDPGGGKSDIVYRTLYGYDPATKRLWVSYPDETGKILPTQYFDDINAYAAWEKTFTPSGPPTQRAPVPTH